MENQQVDTNKAQQDAQVSSALLLQSLGVGKFY